MTNLHAGAGSTGGPGGRELEASRDALPQPNLLPTLAFFLQISTTKLITAEVKLH